MSGSEKIDLKIVEQEVNNDKVYISAAKARAYLKLLFQILADMETKLRASCPHKSTHEESWPDGGSIEVCDDCGMSRYHWEQGETDWIYVKDIPGAKKVVQETIDKLRKEYDKSRGAPKP